MRAWAAGAVSSPETKKRNEDAWAAKELEDKRKREELTQ
jgi:hypothetical protein